MPGRATRTLAVLVAGGLFTVLAACGGGDDGSAADAETTAPATTATSGSTSPGASSDAAAATTTASEPAETAPSTTAGVASGGRPGCPFTDEQVSDVVGVAVAEEGGACLFVPPEKLSPSVLFVWQVPFACNDDIRTEVGYEEPYEGLGVDAYIQTDGAYGTQLLVCTEQPFEVSVDIPLDEAAMLAGVDRLARMVLSG